MTPKERVDDLAKRVGLTKPQADAVRREIVEAVNDELARMRGPKNKEPVWEALWLGQEELNRGIR